MPEVVSAQLAIAQPRRIKATHRRRRKIASGHFVQRYYDPQIGRFLSVDPMASDMNNGWNFNRYNYATNNPYRFTDPDGRKACPGTPKNTCIQPDNSTKKSGTTRKMPEGAAQSVVASKDKFATNVRDKEVPGRVELKADGTHVTKKENGGDSKKSPYGGKVSMGVTQTLNSVALVHSHSDANMDMTTSNTGNGDSDSLLGANPVPMATINGGRVMVRELVDGTLQLRMLQGEFTESENTTVQANADYEQEIFNAR